jgi:hypothetical protein
VERDERGGTVRETGLHEEKIQDLTHITIPVVGEKRFDQPSF